MSKFAKNAKATAESLGKAAARAWPDLAAAFFPERIYCIGCGALIDESRPYSLCNDCLTSFHFATGRTCDKCGKLLEDIYAHRLCYSCMSQEHLFDRGYTCMLYGLYEREAIHAFKYGGRSYYARALGELMYDRVAPLIESGELAFDVVVPVPLHRKKLATRGYNQAELLAREVARRAGVPMERLLVRTKFTKAMSRLSYYERLENLSDVFVIPPARREAAVNTSVLLVDDIYTTGSTADACTAALRAAGVSRVTLLSLAAGGNAKSAAYSDK